MNQNECILVFPSWWPTIEYPLSGSFVLDQTLALKKKYNNPIVVVLFSDKPQNWIIDDSLDFLIINVRNYIPARLGKLFLRLKRSLYIYKFSSAVDKYLKQKRLTPEYAIVQSILGNLFLHNSYLAKSGIPYIIIEHYTTFEKAGEKIFTPYSNLQDAKSFVANANFRFGVSKTFAKKYSNYFNAQFSHLYNPINNLFFQKEITKHKNQKFTFINIGGGTDNRKRPFFILEGLKSAFDFKVKLIFVAKDGLEDRLKEYANSIGFKHELEFYPKISKNELTDLFDQSHVLISASELESFGLTIIEANARGLPTICSKSGGPQEIVTPQTGVLFDVDDAEGFEKGLKYIYENYQKFNSKEIVNYAEENFSEEIYASNILTELNKVKVN